MSIKIKTSPTADTRTCDWSKVTEQQLLESSIMHIGDIVQAMDFFCDKIRYQARVHDWDKIEAIGHFHSDFQTGFKETSWWDNHRKVNRHHLAQEDGIPEDVNLIDVLDYIADCCMAGAARTGSVDKITDIELPNDILQRAFSNTVKLLKNQIEVES